MSAVNRNLIMHTLIQHSKMKDYAQPGLQEPSENAWCRFGFCSGFVSRLSFVTQNIDFFWRFIFFSIFPDE